MVKEWICFVEFTKFIFVLWCVISKQMAYAYKVY